MRATRDLGAESSKAYARDTAPSNAADVASETALRTSLLKTILRDICCTASSILTLSVALHPEMQAKPVQAAGGPQEAHRPSQSVELNSLPDISTVAASANNPAA